MQFEIETHCAHLPFHFRGFGNFTRCGKFSDINWRPEKPDYPSEFPSKIFPNVKNITSHDFIEIKVMVWASLVLSIFLISSRHILYSFLSWSPGINKVEVILVLIILNFFLFLYQIFFQNKFLPTFLLLKSPPLSIWNQARRVTCLVN